MTSTLWAQASSGQCLHRHIVGACRRGRPHRTVARQFFHANALPSVVDKNNQATRQVVDRGVLGVVIVDHGSKRKESNQMLDEFAAVYRQVTGRSIVEIAHMEIATPSILDAVSSCAERGATHIVVAPYFLSRGRHIQTDIPALVEEAQAVHPSLQIVMAEPIGVDALLAQLIDNRIASATSQFEGAGKLES